MLVPSDIERSVRAHFVINRDSTDKPLQTLKNNDEAVGMAVCVFVGLAAYYGIPNRDVENHLAITKEERDNKHKRLKEHLINGRVLAKILKDNPGMSTDEKDNIRASASWRHFVKFEMCKSYIKNMIKKPRGYVDAIDIFRGE